MLSLEAITPTGSGDKVRYFPYRDIEIGYEQVLFNVFSNVVRLYSTPDYSKIKHLGINYVTQPKIVTSSGGSGLRFWPPSKFTVELTNSVG